MATKITTNSKRSLFAIYVFSVAKVPILFSRHFLFSC